ncbi:DNA-formamidopyrimidine glycosylase [Oscillatoriales cyanobacterium USR001]|nr:DNA-formamidopyrimidine glycosylase [Oscillatoriales cyanobacterium USR001]
MPELPEVETICRGLNQLTLGLEILGGDVLLENSIACPISVVDFLAGLQGKAIAHWYRRGKYLLAELGEPGTEKIKSRVREEDFSSIPNSPSWLGVHLRMTGQLLWLDRDEPLQKHTRVRLFLAGGQELRFVDQRTFGKMWWVPPEIEVAKVVTGLKNLGPEPFSAEFSVKYLTAKLQGKMRSIKTALLDQNLVAGLGNIYADEALFLSGVRSQTLCSDLTKDQIKCLHVSIIKVLQNALDAGGTTFSNFLNIHGVNGNYGGIAWVYNRTGQPCRVCGTPIERLKLAGRSSHFCPQCQK